MLWIVVLILTLPLYLPKGHETPPAGAPFVAFFHDKPGSITIRIAGDIPHPGLYRTATPDGVRELLRQAAPQWKPTPAEERLLNHPLADGDMLTVSGLTEEKRTIIWGSIPTRQRLVLGIPLDPGRMSRNDWRTVPGIGPALAARIMTRARQRGGVRTLDDLRGVNGIGERTLERLRPLFK